MLEYILSFGVSEIISHLAFGGLVWLMIWIDTKIRRRRLKQPVGKAFQALQAACEPETLNPKQSWQPRSDASQGSQCDQLVTPPTSAGTTLPSATR